MRNSKKMLFREYAAAIGVKYEELQRLHATSVLTRGTWLEGKRRYVNPDEASEQLREAGIIGPDGRVPAVVQELPEVFEGEEWTEGSLDQWLTREKYFKSKLAELDYLKQSGGLVDLQAVQSEVARILSSARVKLMAIGNKSRTRADLTEKQGEAVDALVREVLEDLDRSLHEVNTA